MDLMVISEVSCVDSQHGPPSVHDKMTHDDKMMTLQQCSILCVLSLIISEHAYMVSSDQVDVVMETDQHVML